MGCGREEGSRARTAWFSNFGAHEANKVIDTQVLTTQCHICKQLAENDNVKLSTIAKDHSCSDNHTGSAGKMESDGALLMFQRSEEKHNLRYTEYLGDGDSKAFATIVENEVYGPNTTISKLECMDTYKSVWAKG